MVVERIEMQRHVWAAMMDAICLRISNHALGSNLDWAGYRLFGKGAWLIAAKRAGLTDADCIDAEIHAKS